MDEISRTHDAYTGSSESFVEKYCAESVAAEYGETFFEALDGDAADEAVAVLDVGCGPGPDVATFSDVGYEVVGFDITADFLQEATRRIPDADFVQGDMRQFPFADAAFDGLWACASFHHVPREDALATLREFHRILRPGGDAFFSVKRVPLDPDEGTDRYFEYYEPDEFQSLLDRAGFDPTIDTPVDQWVGALGTA